MTKKVSKQLQSILGQHMHAVPLPNISEEKTILTTSIERSELVEKDTRLTIVVPESVRFQLKKKLAECPGETVRSLLLRSLKSCYGFEIAEDQIKDKRTIS